MVDSHTSWLIVDSVNNRFDDGVNDGELWMRISHLSVRLSVCLCAPLSIHKQ